MNIREKKPFFWAVMNRCSRSSPSSVGGVQYHLAFRDNAQQGDGQDFFNIFYRQHFATVYPVRVVAGQQQVFFHRVLAHFGTAGLALQNAQDAIRIPYRGHFRVGNHDGFVGIVQGHLGAVLDAGRGVAHDVIEGLRQLVDDFLYAFPGEGFFFTGLGSRQDVQGFHPLILDQRLVQGGFALDHVYEVVNHPAFAIHDQVEVTQAHIEVDYDGLVAALGKAGAD